MPKSALITLTSAGASTGPFDLYSNVDNYATPFETGISKVALMAGYMSNLIPSAAVTVRVKSNGVCVNSVDFTYGTTTTTTTLSPGTTTTTTLSPSTTTSTTTAAPGTTTTTTVAPTTSTTTSTTTSGALTTSTTTSTTTVLWYYPIELCYLNLPTQTGNFFTQAVPLGTFTANSIAVDPLTGDSYRVYGGLTTVLPGGATSINVNATGSFTCPTTTTSTTTSTTTAAPTTTTTSTTTTTTTTLAPRYWGIALCGTTWDNNTYTQLLSQPEFPSPGDIVLNVASGNYYVVQGNTTTSSSGRTIITIEPTALTSCPTTTTSTTTTTTTQP